MNAADDEVVAMFNMRDESVIGLFVAIATDRRFAYAAATARMRTIDIDKTCRGHASDMREARTQGDARHVGAAWRRVVPETGVEPATYALRMRRSTN